MFTIGHGASQISSWPLSSGMKEYLVYVTGEEGFVDHYSGKQILSSLEEKGSILTKAQDVYLELAVDEEGIAVGEPSIILQHNDSQGKDYSSVLDKGAVEELCNYYQTDVFGLGEKIGGKEGNLVSYLSANEGREEIVAIHRKYHPF